MSLRLCRKAFANSDCYSLRVRPYVRTEKDESNRTDLIKFNGTHERNGIKLLIASLR